MRKGQDLMGELFQIIYFNDVERLQIFKEQHPDIYKLKGQLLVDDGLTFDLVNLTYFNYIVFFKVEYKEKFMPFILRQRERIERMLTFWQGELNEDIRQRVISYNNYWESFYCADPSIYDEVAWDPMSEYLDKGYREEDLRLYNRAEAFDFEGAKKWLEAGGNPYFVFYGDEYSSIMYHLASERDFLSTCKVLDNFEAFEKMGYELDFDVLEEFGYLLGLAAHIEMYQFLKSLHAKNRIGFGFR